MIDRYSNRPAAALHFKPDVGNVVAVCLIVALSLAVAFPAVAHIVEESKLDGCKRNLVVLGKVLAVYQVGSNNAWPIVSTRPILGPPGVTTAQAEKRTAEVRRKDAGAPAYSASGYSWIAMLLPYYGEEPLYRTMNARSRRFVDDAFDVRLRGDDGEHVSMHALEFFHCPAFEGKSEPNWTSSAPEYKDLVKSLDLPAESKGGVALTNYVAVTATHLDLALNPQPKTDEEKPNGVIVYSERMRGVAKIADGDSNTIVISETREPNYASWLDGTTSWVVAHNPNSKPPVASKDHKGRWVCREEDGCRDALNVGPRGDGSLDYYYREKWAGQEPWQFGPSSMHEGHRINHLFGDKHVASIVASGPNAISANVYLALVTRNGGEDEKYSE
ncbi:MAG: DUF1559 domain-containing protein [Pirellulales bacterium]